MLKSRQRLVQPAGSRKQKTPPGRPGVGYGVRASYPSALLSRVEVISPPGCGRLKADFIATKYEFDIKPKRINFQALELPTLAPRLFLNLTISEDCPDELQP
jgi:hypothetical protein